MQNTGTHHRITTCFRPKPVPGGSLKTFFKKETHRKKFSWSAFTTFDVAVEFVELRPTSNFIQIAWVVDHVSHGFLAARIPGIDRKNRKLQKQLIVLCNSIFIRIQVLLFDKLTSIIGLLNSSAETSITQ